MRVRYPFAGSFAAILVLAGYLGLSSTQISSVNDKVLHFIVFFLLTITLYWAVELPRRLLMKISLGAILVLGVGSEFLQDLLPNGRDFDPADIAANLMGSFLGLALSQWYHKRMLERKRRRKLEGYGLVGAGADDLELGEGSGPGPSLNELGVVTEDEAEGDDDDDDDGAAWDDMDGNNNGGDGNGKGKGIANGD